MTIRRFQTTISVNNAHLGLLNNFTKIYVAAFDRGLNHVYYITNNCKTVISIHLTKIIVV